MPAFKIIKLSENPDFKTALREFLERANDFDMEITGILGCFSRRYKFAGIFHPEKPKNGSLKSVVLADEGDYDRAQMHAENWLNQNQEKNVLCMVTIFCFSYKIIAFWKE